MSTRVILADDHRLLLELLRELLDHELDIRVVGQATSGRELLVKVRELVPDVVVLDIAMPELNGIDACAAISRRWPDIHVLCLSAYPDPPYVREMLKAGAAGFVSKDAASSELVRGIRTVAAGGRYFCSNVAAAAIAASPAPMPGSVAALGRRERAVLQLLAEGHPTGSVAEKLYISVATVETHRRNIMRKLGLHSTAQLVRLAIREGLVTA